jgi:NTP pyrophosphatase (non-canonical NTP hydrolase)
MTKRKKLSAYTMHGKVWPGLGKVIEEAGEVIQICGKLTTNSGDSKYYGSVNLRKKLQEEIADLRAALLFVEYENNLDFDFIELRVHEKLNKYYKWKKDKQ